MLPLLSSLSEYTPNWLREDVLGVWGAGPAACPFFIAPGGEARASSHLGTVAGRPSLGRPEQDQPFLLVCSLSVKYLADLSQFKPAYPLTQQLHF